MTEGEHTTDGVVGPADYARVCVGRHVRREPVPQAPGHALYEQRAACFVSLKKHGELRGCVGTLAPAEPDLGSEISRNAYAAAFNDPRFAPVRPGELDDLTCSVDILSASEPCALDELDARRFGVIVRSGWRRGVLLPDLAGVDSVATQVGIALEKAGIRPSEAYEVERFRVIRCREGDSAETVLAEQEEAGRDADG
ncbi:MAG: AmmeMemoRadiSam system protein A [Thermoleophilia bacterium]